MKYTFASSILWAFFLLSSVSSAQTTTYTFCSNENEYCSFSGTRTVRYGANGSYFTRTFSDGVSCSNSVFGDPIFGTFKRCELASTTTTVDTQAPTVPQGLSASAVSSSSINLTYSASTDNVGVTGYLIERCQGASCTNFVQVGTSSGLSHSSTGLLANTLYRFRVRATDAAANRSGYSAIAQATTQSTGTTTYTFCSNENEYCSFSGTRTVRYGANGSYFTRTFSDGVSCSNSVFGDPIFGTFKRCELASTTTTVDTQAPTVPQGLSASAVSSSSINLTYSASTDNVGVTGYLIERCQGASCTNFVQVGTSSGLSHSSTGLLANTLYRFRVRATDAAANRSGYSAVAQATTQSTGTTDNPLWVPRNSTRAFLSGHSLTDDPHAELIGEIAQKRGDSYNYNEQIIIGSPIRVRTRGGTPSGWEGYSHGKNRHGSSGLNVINELRNPQTIGPGERYDTLILAENHSVLDMIGWESTIPLVRHYHDRVIESSSNARTFFYNTWLDINKTSPNIWIEHEKKTMVVWECVASKVNLSLQAAGRSDRVQNLPIGAGLVRLVERALAGQVPGITGTTTQKLDMIFNDNVHTTRLGMYYTALLTYAATYGKTPEGTTPPPDISSTTAAALQSIAWEFIDNYFRPANSGTRTMQECRQFLEQQYCQSYINMKNQGSVLGCQQYYSGSNSPFNDVNFTPLPPP